MIPYYKNNEYRTYNSINNLFKKNPNNLVQSYVDQMSEIKEQYAQEEAKSKIKIFSSFSSTTTAGETKVKPKVNKYAD